MVADAHDWEQEVQAAAVRGDGVELRRLFEQAQRQFGASAGERWARVLSALDGTAVTG
ncbi:MAG: hypothetical protein PHU75_08005 [Candidatus Nanopelagicales bacterium]|nr:hypothetical protein [Candidatus Nanopelagicales bacterium]